MTEAKERIMATLRDKAARILHVPASSVDGNKSIWDYFPPNPSPYREAKEVAEFSSFISNEYKVYLTEREWEAPTLAKLADLILDKQSNPKHMLAQIEKNRGSQKRGLVTALVSFPVMFGLAGAAMAYGASPEKIWNVVLSVVAVMGVAELLVVGIWVASSKKFERETKPVLEFYGMKRSHT